eukprot:Tamp_03998.p1 GENE.Tamp_03998~~Tamp_03998.p1  ORF type:complete len:771 (-),score=244.72 Tamp_03998:328-2640(-)
MPLNPNASAFNFNPGASEFVPFDKSPKPSPANGAKPSPTKPSPALVAAAAVSEFVPGNFSLGAPACAPAAAATAPAEKEAPAENGAPPSPSKPLEAKRPAALSVTDPAGAPAAQAPAAPAPPAPAEPEVFSGRYAGKVKLSRDVGKRYSLRVMKLLQHDQKYIDMEHTPELQSQIVEFRRLLEQATELDASKDMPARQQDGGRGTPRIGGPGTPKGGRGKKNAEPLRDRTGKIIEIKALEISENRWKPTKPTDDEEKIYKAIKGVLNKLTLEKFDKLYQELIAIGISTASLLRGFVVILYDKAVLEPNFIGMYAQMCERLAKDLPELSDEAGVLPFSEVLVGKCRSEFELMGKEPERENMGDLSAEDRDHKLKKLRQRTLGNVEFIGELFKKKMVDLETLEGLLNKLLDTSPEDHDSIHPLVKLLESTGKPLETASKEKMDDYFVRIQELAAQPGLSSRYKFMLLDLKDLRAKDWVPRRAAAGPQTLEAVKKEVDKESRFTEKPKDKEAEKKKKEKERQKNKPVEDDGWAQVGTPVKRKGKAQTGSGPNSPLPLSRQGSRENLAKKPPTRGGGFAALMMDDDDDDDDSDKSDSDAESKSASEESDDDAGAEEEEEGEELSEEGENKVGGILREYLSILDKEEAKACIGEMWEKGFPKSRVNVEVVKQGLMQAMDGTERDGEVVGDLIGYLVKDQILSEDAVAKGFVAVLQDLPDITIDIPMAPKIVGGVLEKLLELEFVSKPILAPALKELEEAGCGRQAFEKVQALIAA